MVLEGFYWTIGIIIFFVGSFFVIYTLLNKGKTAEEKRKEKEKLIKFLKVCMWIAIIFLLDYLFPDILNKIAYGVNDEPFFFILGVIVGYLIWGRNS